MQGKILSPDIILGYNGTKYSFSTHDILNLKQNNNPSDLIGCLVNFKFLEDRAIEIYLINYLRNNQHYQIDMDIKSVKLRALTSATFLITSPFINNEIPLVGTIIGIIGIFLLFSTIKKMSEISQSPNLFRNFIIFVLLNIANKAVGVILIYKNLPNFSIDDGLSNFLKIYQDNIMLISLLIISTISLLILYISILREFAYLTGQKLFLWCAMACIVVNILDIFLPKIATAAAFLAFLFYALAWFKTEEIIVYNEEDKIPWF